MGKTILIVALLTLVAADKPATQPTSRPVATEAQTQLEKAMAELKSAQEKAGLEFEKTEEFRDLAAEAAERESVLKEAQKGSDAGKKAAASKDFDEVKRRIALARQNSIDQDDDVNLAFRRVEAAKAATEKKAK